jgi:glycerol uptake facilitator protein
MLRIIVVNEFIGTAILILLGCGIGALVSLTFSLGHQAGNWVLTSLGWGMAVYVGASVAWSSGANLNPAVTLALTVNGTQTWASFPFYIVGEVLGAMFGAFLVYLMYKKQFDTNKTPEKTGGIFYTGPAPECRSLGWNTVSETIATFVLVYWIIQQAPWEPATADQAPALGNIALGYAGVAFAVLAIGAGLGGATGYAINPARDFGPRVVYALLPIKGKQKIDWAYAWVPIVGPLVGGLLAAGLYSANF